MVGDPRKACGLLIFVLITTQLTARVVWEHVWSRKSNILTQVDLPRVDSVDRASVFRESKLNPPYNRSWLTHLELMHRPSPLVDTPQVDASAEACHTLDRPRVQYALTVQPLSCLHG